MSDVIVTDLATGETIVRAFTPEEEAARAIHVAAWEAGAAGRRAAAIAERRYLAEIGGAVWSGWPVATDRDSQAKINAAYALARDGYWQTGAGWKYADGVYRALTAEQVIAMALAVSAHVQACFAHEAVLMADPSADIDVGWPASA